MTLCLLAPHCQGTIWVNNMAVVPPGNKLVGEYTGIVTLAGTGMAVSNYGESLSVLAIDPATVNYSVSPKNAMIGEYTGIATLAGVGAAVNNYGMSGAAVVYIETPPAAYNFGMSGNVVVESGDPDPTIPKPRNLMVGEYTGIATVAGNGMTACNFGMSAEVVVQQITKRVETVLINLAYPEGFTG